MHLLLTVCDNGAIRLVLGSDQYSGQVEVCVDRSWGTICSMGWENVDAGVACRQLGYSEQSKLLNKSIILSPIPLFFFHQMPLH